MCCPLSIVTTAVHDDVFDADRELVRILERRAIDDAIRIEDRHVGPQAFPEPAAIFDADLVGVHAGHLLDGLRQREDLQLPHVAAEHARERAVVARDAGATGRSGPPD